MKGNSNWWCEYKYCFLGRPSGFQCSDYLWFEYVACGTANTLGNVHYSFGRHKSTNQRPITRSTNKNYNYEFKQRVEALENGQKGQQTEEKKTQYMARHIHEYNTITTIALFQLNKLRHRRENWLFLLYY